MFRGRPLRIGGFAVDFHLPHMFSSPSLRALLRSAPFIGDDGEDDAAERERLSPASALSGTSNHASPRNRDRDRFDSPERRPLNRSTYRGRSRDGPAVGLNGVNFDEEDSGNVCSFLYRLFYLLAMVCFFVFEIFLRRSRDLEPFV